MIKFFRRIRQQLISENKFKKYLLYAIGEIILVVIGILIALQINNWNENRQQNERNQIFISKLKTQINKNTKTTNNYLEDNQQLLHISKKLLKKIDTQHLTFSAKQLDTLVLVNALDFFMNLDMIVLEEGKSNGNLALVESDSLRESLYKFIKEYDIYSAREKVVNEDLSINFKPYLNQHYNIRNLIHTSGRTDIGESAFNTTILEIIQDPEFENHITTRLMLQEDMVNSIQDLANQLQVVNKHLQ